MEISNRFAASGRLYGEWLISLTEHSVKEDSDLSLFPEKDSARTSIEGNITLSVPIKGGASRLKKHTFHADLPLSDHGRWRETHLGALAAQYGKTPYFAYLFPEIKNIYEKSKADSFFSFSNKIHTLISHNLGIEQKIPETVKELKEKNPVLYNSLREEWQGRITERMLDLSIFDTLFRFGPMTAPALMMKLDL